MRLIDADEMAVNESEAYVSVQISGKVSPITQGLNSVVHKKIQMLISDTPTVDLETLPIVQELREQIAKVTAERDALKSNPPVEIESDAFELATQLATQLAKVTAKRDTYEINSLTRAGLDWLGRELGVKIYDMEELK